MTDNSSPSHFANFVSLRHINLRTTEQQLHLTQNTQPLAELCASSSAVKRLCSAQDSGWVRLRSSFGSDHALCEGVPPFKQWRLPVFAKTKLQTMPSPYTKVVFCISITLCILVVQCSVVNAGWSECFEIFYLNVNIINSAI